jgi:uncharacterized SAM-binding protein YcdF (DUF218 family)
MGFWLRKFAADLVLSGGIVFGLLLLGAVLGARAGGRARRLGRAAWIVAVATLYLLSVQPVSQAFLLPLERHHPVPTEDEVRAADVIVVLSGGLALDPSRPGEPTPSRISTARTLAAVRLQKRTGKRLVISGGSGGADERPGPSEAQGMRLAALDMGVPEAQVLLEERSRASGESARYVAEMLRGSGERRVVLVTSAYHLPRSVLLFRQQGLDVVPYPADFVGRPLSFGPRSFVPMFSRLALVDAALHEYVGLIVSTLES